MPAEWVTTITLLRGLRDFNDDSSWRRFVDRFHGPVVRFVRKIGIPASDAEDVAQEALIAFAEAYRDGHYDAQKGRLSRWLFGIAFNHVQRYRQRLARRASKDLGQMGETSFWRNLPDKDDLETTWDREWEETLWHTCLRRARAEIPVQTMRIFERAVFGPDGGLEAMVGHRSKGWADEVAAELGVSVKAVYNAKHRVLKRIREMRAELDDM